MKLKKRVKLLSALVGVTLIVAPAVAYAQRPVSTAKPTAPSTNLTGLDVSWPQCGKKLPTNQAFAIVGVNGGKATTTNPCLAEQLNWGDRSLGGVNQPKLQLYVNTANPGGLGTISWPSNNTDPVGLTTSNPHGTCNNGDDLACAWQYGWNRAVEAAEQRFKPAAVTSGVSQNTGSYVWWLDVETENTWKTGGTDFDYASNVTVLEGMTSYFKGLGAKVGLYSTKLQWDEIVGGAVGTNSNLNGLDNWRPSGSSLNNAKANCSLVSFNAGGKVTMTQYISKQLDYDYSCV